MQKKIIIIEKIKKYRKCPALGQYSHPSNPFITHLEAGGEVGRLVDGPHGGCLVRVEVLAQLPGHVGREHLLHLGHAGPSADEDDLKWEKEAK